ncbi:hypothetical protein [Mucilaginibacter gotjawali]|uniref:Uncharacterized protein n=2 Tax=Mucilaginibacter gotjawali TaxID=1550579 RepID=A0A839SDZ1_9SPHI|nr:hypothetical protein [Mucilaginibacter gotjawali]MBB3055996.1 hypothetical protein [Mucilaginibacter gotjawali]BAU53668.1 hypothetical protein MgSA37_01837 [Mucilaginibacter gotjawali]
MELKPVIHQHDSLNFEASNALMNVIAFFKGRLLGTMVPLWGIYLIWSSNLFRACGNTINLLYFMAEMILTAVTVFVSYSLVNRIRLIVLTIGRQVSITNEEIAITTFAFNLRFWNKKQPSTLVFKINELKIRKTDNPLRFIRISENFNYRVFELRDKTITAYVIFDYFDALLKEKLTEILVEVTPPELLMPGRLRHY